MPQAGRASQSTMHHAPWHGEWRVDEPYPFCTTVGSMPIKALACRAGEF
jgi:hypothetical protein